MNRVITEPRARAAAERASGARVEVERAAGDAANGAAAVQLRLRLQ